MGNTLYADFSFMQGAMINEPIYFNDRSKSIGAPVTSWNWDFGDGQTSKSQFPEHSFSRVGADEVTLTVSNGKNTDRSDLNFFYSGEKSGFCPQMKAFLHCIAALRSKKKTKYEGKMLILQTIIKSLNHFIVKDLLFT